jgi:hypothetical protein
LIDGVGRLDVKAVKLQARVGAGTGLVVVGDLIDEGPDSPLEGTGFEPGWGFSCQVVVFGFAGSLFGAGKPFFVPSSAIRFAERAEGVKGPKR